MVQAQDVDTPHEMVDAIEEQSSWSSLSSKLQCCISASANERPPPPTPFDEQQSKKLPAPNCSSPKIYLDASFASLKRSISGVWHARPAASHSPRLRRGDPARYRRSICRPEGSPRRRNDRAPLTRGGRDGAHRPSGKGGDRAERAWWRRARGRRPDAEEHPRSGGVRILFGRRACPGWRRGGSQSHQCPCSKELPAARPAGAPCRSPLSSRRPPRPSARVTPGRGAV